MSDTDGKGRALASLILGVVSLGGGLIPILGLVGVVAIVLGNRARTSVHTAESGTGLATVGLVLGVVGLGLGITSYVLIATS